MIKKTIPLMICVLVLAFVLAGCAGKTNPAASASPSASAATASADASASSSADTSASPAASASATPSPVPAPTPDGFVMGKVTAISGNSITVSTVNPAGTKTITAESYTTFTVSGSTKTAALSDIAVDDVITATLSGTSAINVIDDGPTVNPDPSAYVSPSPSDTASPSPSAS